MKNLFVKPLAACAALALLVPPGARAETIAYDYYNGGGTGSGSPIWGHDGALYAFFWDQGVYRIGVWRPGGAGLETGMEPLNRATVDVAFVNPYSENRDAAIRYLETVAGSIPDYMRAYLLSGWAEPVMLDGADEKLAQADERIAALEAGVAKATGKGKDMYQEMLNAEKADRERLVASWCWMVSAEELERYQAYAGTSASGSISGSTSPGGTRCTS